MKLKPKRFVITTLVPAPRGVPAVKAYYAGAELSYNQADAVLLRTHEAAVYKKHSLERASYASGLSLKIEELED